MASSLVIAPSLGHALVTGQGQPGGYDAIDDRGFWGVGLQEGAVEVAAFAVTERGAGANMTVDVAADAGHLVVEGDDVDFQGLYLVRPHPSVANLDVAAADPTDPRIDSVVVQVEDDEHDLSGNTRAVVEVLTGTPTAGADIDDRLGAPALPDSAMLLADILVPASDTSITDSQIRDRRKWARGLRVVEERTASGGTFGTTFADTGLWDLRVELSGAPLEIGGMILLGGNTAGARVFAAVYMDGSEVFRVETTAAGTNLYETATFDYTIESPTPGSHTFTVEGMVSSGLGNLDNTAPSQLKLREDVAEIFDAG